MLPCDFCAGTTRALEARQVWIGFWNEPPAEDKPLEQLARQYFNLSWTSPDGLAVAASQKLKVMMHDAELLSPRMLDHPRNRARLDATIDKVRSTPATKAYFLRDKPGANEFGK